MTLTQRRSAPPSDRMERWEPARDFEQVADRMQRLLDETLGGSPLLAEEEHPRASC